MNYLHAPLNLQLFSLFFFKLSRTHIITEFYNCFERQYNKPYKFCKIKRTTSF